MSEVTTSGCSLSDISAMMNNNGNNNWNNNPFMYLIWLAYLGGGGFGFGNNRNGAAEAASTATIDMNAKLNQLSQQISDNQATNSLASTINANHDYLHDFNTNVTAGFAGTQAAINAAAQGDLIGQKDLQAAMQSGFCSNNTAILNQTNQLQSQIENTRQAVVNGFSQLGYAQALQTNELNTNATANTQRILDQMCQNATQALRDKVLELSQEAQTANIVGQLKSSCSCGS